MNDAVNSYVVLTATITVRIKTDVEKSNHSII